jgi:TolB-like protein/Tfp pilus assembly protein PilF
VFIGPDGRVKILDFGLARLEGHASPHAEHLPVAEPDTRMEFGPAVQTAVQGSAAAETFVPPNETRSTLMGTVGYMSPEHLRGELVDARTDIFALGCVLYEMLTGQRAFARPTQAETISAVLTQEPEELEDVAEVPAPLRELVRRCLAKEAGQRFSSARDVATELRRVRHEALARRPRRNQILLWAVGLALTAALVIALYLLHDKGANTTDAIDSIAVLPLKTSGEDREGSLCDGLSEGLIRSLSRATDLRVQSWGTLQQFRDRLHDPITLGQHLGVRTVLAGQAKLRDDQLEIALELIDVRDGRQLWGERYVRRPTELQVVQELIATEVAKRLQLRLSTEQARELTRRDTEDSHAHMLYTRGRFFWNKRTKQDIRTAIRSFQEATTKDPRYALAHAGLADSYNLLATYGFVSPESAFPSAKEAVDRALTLDSSLAEAHAALAQIKEVWERDWIGAEREFQRALQLNPKYATGHQWYAFCLAEMGRLKEAKAEMKRALELDPFSLSINSAQGWILYLNREYDAAVDQYLRTLEMDRHFTPARASLCLAYAQKGQYADALAAIEKAREHALEEDAESLAFLGHVHARAGRPDEARKVLQQLAELGRRNHVSSYHAAIVHAHLGEKDAAFAALERAFNENACAIVSLRIDPLLDPLRSDPRFAELLTRLDLPLDQLK